MTGSQTQRDELFESIDVETCTELQSQVQAAREGRTCSTAASLAA